MKNYRGLTQAEAAESRRKNGSNILTQKKRKTLIQTYCGKFRDPIIVVLLIALGINIVFTFFGKVDFYECVGIFISVLISTMISTWSEYNNETTFQKLQEEASQILCKVYRDGRLCEIPIGEITVGDAILLQSGDAVPADGIVRQGRVRVDQSALNGESREAEKSETGQRQGMGDFLDGCSVFRGSVVCSGECVMEAETVGDATVYGKLTAETQTEQRESPLAVKLAKLAQSISRFGYLGAALLVAVSFLQNAVLNQHCNPALIAAYFADTGGVVSDLLNSLIMGIVVVVMAVPEGLPLMIAIVCSLNMKKMLKSKVLVRKLVGIETAGGINILFTDKTGTITKGKPEVIRFLDAEANGYSSVRKIPQELKKAVVLSMTANSSAQFSGSKVIGGNAAEQAMLAFVGRYEAAADGTETVARIPFRSDSKFSAAQVRGRYTATLVKGAPEMILPRCQTCMGTDGNEKPWKNSGTLEQEMNRLANQSVRLIALAVSKEPIRDEGLPNRMTLLGVVAIRDDVRPEAKRAVYEVNRAGIRIVMITGDRRETAVAVAKEAGLLNDADAVVLTSQELAALRDDEVKELLPRIRVIARALPTDKSRLVELAQQMGMVVGMTGDGLNDAPALKRADVGFAMGSGSEVAKEAGDIVILDDNFFSIRNAVLYGRTIYNSIKKFIRFQLTINVAAVTVSILGPIVGVEKPLDISQMIWTNLMIDSLAAIAFGGEPALTSYLAEKPRKREEAILDRDMWSSLIINGLYICSLSLLFFILPQIRAWFRPSENEIVFYTGYFAFFIFSCVFNAFNTRTDSIDLLDKLALNKQFVTVMGGISAAQVFMTYHGGKLLRTAGLNFREWMLVLALALTIIPIDIIRKICMKR